MGDPIQELTDLLRGPVRAHLIGVAGSGMSGLASLLLEMGHAVSGSDRVTTLETERLEKAGLRFTCPHTEACVAGADLVIYSSAIRPGNAAYDAAVQRGIRLVRRAEALAAIMAGKRGIVIAGTHGKTTTSAMAAYALRAGGIHPSHYVGAEIPILGTNAHWDPAGEHMVAEGDESDGTLVNFRPEHAIILNIEAEHLDHYGSLEEIVAVFQKLADQTTGTIFYCHDDAGSRALGESIPGAVSFGLTEGAAVRAAEVQTGPRGSAFVIEQNGARIGGAELSIPGEHNVQNAAAVAALALHLGIPFEAFRSAVGSFRGARRRFDVKYESPNFAVIDDYGHHPTEIQATLRAARAFAGPDRRIVCLFQPHRYTRTQLLCAEFATAFDEADALFVADIYPASEPPIPGVTGKLISDAVAEGGAVAESEFAGPKGNARLRCGNALRPGDVFITLGAGDIHEVGTRIAADLKRLEAIRAAMDDAEGKVKLYEPMSRHTTLRVGGPADFWIEPATEGGFARAVKFLRAEGIPLRVIGRGSNLLVKDGGIRGAVLHPGKGEFEAISASGDQISAGVGARFKAVAYAAREAGLGGFEWMEGIPGNVGGGLRMNAGAMGAETFDQVVSVRYIDGATGEIKEKTGAEFAYQYRFVPDLLENFAVAATFSGVPAERGGIDEKLLASRTKRRESQPVAPSAGCIFKNPGPIPAGKLVDELGLKNRHVGAARVSEVHGNFIVNDGGATAADVLTLIDQIKAAAREARGIELETEVQILGEDTADSLPPAA